MSQAPPETPVRPAARPGWVWMAPLAVFVALAALLAAGLLHGRPTDARGAMARPLPAFALQPLAPGAPGLADADVRGRVSLINVFASWCPSCAQEQPMLARLAAESGAPLYGVAWLDAPDKTRAWLAQHGDPFARVGQDASGRLGLDLGVTGAPETFVVDARGRIRYRQAGPIDEATRRGVLQPLVTRLEAEARRAG